MEFIYDVENNDFSVDFNDVHKAENVVTYSIPTINPALEFNKCLRVAEKMRDIHPTLVPFLYSQVDNIPHNVIHQSIFNLKTEHEGYTAAIQAGPPASSDPEDERDGLNFYVEQLQGEIKHMDKYLRSSEATLKHKLYLGMIEVGGDEYSARFYLDYILDPIVHLTFRLDEVQVTANPDAPAVEQKAPSNVVSLSSRRRTEEKV